MRNIVLGNATTHRYRPYNGGVKVSLGCEWRRRVFGECNWRLLDCRFLTSLEKERESRDFNRKVKRK